MSESTEVNGAQRQMLYGTVASDKMQKTIVVSVERRIKHPVYGKIMKLHKKYKAHDPEEKANVGDEVSIRACRPLSKQKRWELVEILRVNEEAQA